MKGLWGFRENILSICVCVSTRARSVCALKCWGYLVIRTVFLKVIGHLQSITGIASESIADFSYAILTHSVGANTPGQQQPVPHRAARALRTAASTNSWGWLTCTALSLDPFLVYFHTQGTKIPSFLWTVFCIPISGMLFFSTSEIVMGDKHICCAMVG